MSTTSAWQRQYLWHARLDWVRRVSTARLHYAAAGTDWDVDFGYMSKRGFNAATKFTYGNDFIWGGEKPFRGLLDAFYIDDGGLDTLGTGSGKYGARGDAALPLPWPASPDSR